MLALAAQPADDDFGFTLLYSSIKPKVDALLVAVNILNADVTKWYSSAAKNTSSDAFANAWIAWRDTFYGWYKYSTERWSTVFPPAPWTLENDVTQRVAELATWRKQWETLSGLSATGPNPADTIPQTGIGGTSWLIWGGVALAGALAALWAAKKFARFTPQGAMVHALTTKSAAVSGARYRRFAR
jgi:LPXTG-motif cell wall-anchored protein